MIFSKSGWKAICALSLFSGLVRFSGFAQKPDSVQKALPQLWDSSAFVMPPDPYDSLVFQFGDPVVIEDKARVWPVQGIPLTDIVGVAPASSASPLTGLNLEPGVHMDSRGPGGSSRISLRGSLIRSNFGTRNIRLYWEDIPLSSPDGSTPIELLDAGISGNIEILKGPSTAFSGNGTSGGLSFSLKKGPEWEACLGQPWGLTRFSGVMKFPLPSQEENPRDLRSTLAVSVQHWGGYREQEQNSKGMVAAQFGFCLNPGIKKGITIWRMENRILAYAGSWQLPGSIDSLTWRKNPQTANPYSVANQAQLDKKILVLSSGFHRHGKRSMTKLMVFGQASDKRNPYGTSPANQGYKLEQPVSAGAIGTWECWNGDVFRIKSFRMYLPETGIEIQQEGLNTKEFVNDSGKAGNQKSEHFSNSRTGRIWAGCRFSLGNQLEFQPRIGLSGNAFSLNDRFQVDSTNLSFRRGWKAYQVYSFRIIWRLGKEEQSLLSAWISNGISPPGIFEFAAVNKSVATNLRNEHADQFCLSYLQSILRQRFFIQSSVYWIRIRDAITTVILPDGAITYQNALRLNLPGAEVSLLLPEMIWKKWTMKFAASWTGNIYHFAEYTDLGGWDLGGKRIPGLPFQNAGLSGTLAKGRGWFNPVVIWQSAQYSDSRNLFRQSPALLIHVKAGIVLKNCDSGLKISFFSGIENLLNEDWNAFPAIDAAGGKFYNPGPGRWAYAGLKLD